MEMIHFYKTIFCYMMDKYNKKEEADNCAQKGREANVHQHF